MKHEGAFGRYDAVGLSSTTTTDYVVYVYLFSRGFHVDVLSSRSAFRDCGPSMVKLLTLRFGVLLSV